MKKTLLVFSLICFFAFHSFAQPSLLTNIYYGYYAVPQDSAYRLSCGLTTTIKPGYLSFGYNAAVSTSTVSWFGSKNFMITGYGNSFMWKGYDVFDANNCTGSLTKINNCGGITAVEVNGLNNVRYAIAGSYDKAVFFTTIDSLGLVINYISYPFPVTGQTGFAKPSKPVIIKSDVPQQYYICGTFENNMYILNVDAIGNIIWSSFYHAQNGIEPRDLMMDPYQMHQLVIVGAIKTGTQDKDAFFMRVDGSNGAAGNMKLFGQSFSDDIFKSIDRASHVSSNNGQGFIVSGYAQDASGNNKGTAWVVKLDPSGSIIWNHLIVPSTGTNLGAVDVKERLNTTNAYEYYLLIESTAGMQVAKLDDAGLPFQFYNPSGPSNEFVYNVGTTICRPLSIDYVNTASPGNYTGIQVYGTMIGYLIYLQVNASVVVSSYFNGETNCYNSSTKLTRYSEGPGAHGDQSVSSFGSLTTCTNFLVTHSFGGIIAAYNCGNIIPNGSNLRTAGNGEPLKLIDEEKAQGVFPNPVVDRTNVTYKSQDYSKVQITLFDVTGKIILSFKPNAKPEGTYTEEIDFSVLDLKSGVYFLSTSVDGVSSKEKIVYTK